MRGELCFGLRCGRELRSTMPAAPVCRHLLAQGAAVVGQYRLAQKFLQALTALPIGPPEALMTSSLMSVN